MRQPLDMQSASRGSSYGLPAHHRRESNIPGRVPPSRVGAVDNWPAVATAQSQA